MRVKVSEKTRVVIGGYPQTLMPGDVYEINDETLLAQLSNVLIPLEQTTVTRGLNELIDLPTKDIKMATFDAMKYQPFMISCQQRGDERAKTLSQLEALGITGWQDIADAAPNTPALVIGSCDPPTPRDNRRQALLGLELAAKAGVSALMFEDDIDIHADLLTWLECAYYLDDVMSFCAWNENNHPLRVARAAERRERIETQVVDAINLDKFWGSQCLYIPARLVGALLKRGNDGNDEPFDIFLGKACKQLNEPIKIAVPNPVQHRRASTLVDSNRNTKPSLTYDLGKLEPEVLAKVAVKVLMLETTSVPMGVYKMNLAEGTIQTVPYGLAKRLVDEGKARQNISEHGTFTTQGAITSTREPEPEESAPAPKPEPEFYEVDDPETVLESPETEFDDVPHREHLELAGVHTIDDIPLTKSGLVKLDGIGDARADDILAWLTEHGEL